MLLAQEVKIAKEELAYTPCYCEENSYLLIRRLEKEGVADVRDLYAVFISNPRKAVPFWHQQAGDPVNDGQIVWDYHVLVIQAFQSEGAEPGLRGARVWDLDTTLGFPVDFSQYAERALRPDSIDWAGNERYRRRYRVVQGAAFLRHFASDRSHMKREDGTFMATPPSYSPIRSSMAESSMNLPEYMNMSRPDIIASLEAAFDSDAEEGGPGESGSTVEEAPPGPPPPSLSVSGPVALSDLEGRGFGVCLEEAEFLSLFRTGVTAGIAGA